MNDISIDPSRSGGANALETIKKLVGNRIGPFAKAPMELMFNKNLFYDKPILNKELPANMQTAAAPAILKTAMNTIPEGKTKDTLKDLLRYVEKPKTSEVTGKTMNQPQMNAILSYLFNTFGGVAARYGNLPKNMENELANMDLGASTPEKILAALTAVVSPLKTERYNIKEQELSNRKAREAELQSRINYLIEMGLMDKLK